MLAARYHGLLFVLYAWMFVGTSMSLARTFRGIVRLPGRWLEMARLGDEGLDIALAEAVSNLQCARAGGSLPVPDGLWARINRLHPARRLVAS